MLSTGKPFPISAVSAGNESGAVLPKAVEGKRDSPCLRLAKARSKLLIAVERRYRGWCGFAAGKEAPSEYRCACSRFLPKAKEGKRDTFNG
jgi:hypothetical protein